MTQEELFQALNEAIEILVPDGNEPNTITGPEWQGMRKIGRQAASNELSKLVELGKLERTMVRRNNAWGKSSRTQGYRVNG